MHFNLKTPYNGSVYKLPKEKLALLSTLNSQVSIRALLLNWISLILITQLGMHLVSSAYFLLLYFPISFVIAGRFGVFIQLAHEACHGVLLKSKRRNAFIAKWFCTLPIGVFYDGYASGHLKHHAWAGTEKDPDSDSEKYKIVDTSNPKLYLLFLKDLLGLTALSVFFKYRENETGAPLTHKIFSLCFVQAVLFTLLFRWDIKSYLLFWIFPAISSHMVLMRIRGMAEHGLAGQLGRVVHEGSEGTFYTRTFLTPGHSYSFLPLVWIEKLLIGSLNVHYHHEHHLFPSVPYYHLPELHEIISPLAKQNNPDIYAKGYFTAALKFPNQGLVHETI